VPIWMKPARAPAWTRSAISSSKVLTGFTDHTARAGTMGLAFALPILQIT
jgi:hypothetical protein